MAKTVLLTGGAGFIGSHTAVELLKADFNVVIVDDLSNSCKSVIKRIQKITGKEVTVYYENAADEKVIDRIFSQHSIEAVIHFAGFKAVGESIQKPLEYYRNNLGTVLTLLESMKRNGVDNFVFSSSATVYGMDNEVPFVEDDSTGNCTNPYGWTKYMIEQILRDLASAEPQMSVTILRYFNPIGAHESGLIGEKPIGIPNNLMPYITQTAAGIRDKLFVFGNDYPTCDGTGVRDYIHVVDLAKGHLAALRYTEAHHGIETFNLGTGTGYSVLELVKAFEKATGIEIPYKIVTRRPGDIAECYADTQKAKRLLGWTAEKSLEDMCRDSWRWQQYSENCEE